MKRETMLFRILTVLMIISTLMTTLVSAKEKEVNEGSKTVYLTFDDGPTKVTSEVIKMLDKHKVKGTFFVVGMQVEQNPDILKDMIKKGHSICPHSYDHNSSINYNNVESFTKDYNKCIEVIKKNSGISLGNIFRFPGGSDTGFANKYVLRNIRTAMVDKGLYYMDWNLCINDSLARNIPAERLINTYNKSFVDQDAIVVLMHDGAYNGSTVEALDYIIKDLKTKGYEFKAVDDIKGKEFEKLYTNGILNKYDKGIHPSMDKKGDNDQKTGIME